MSKSRVRNIMRRTSKVTSAIERGLKKVAKNQPISSNNMTRVFSSLKNRINQGVRQLRGIGRTIKLRGRGRSRGRGRN